MTTSRISCEADEQCPNEARGLCFHCSRNICIDHLTQHDQYINSLDRLSLNDYSKLLTDHFLRLQSLTISQIILDKPFLKLEQWRSDAHHQIDEIVEKKCKEIHKQIDEYRQIFDTMRNEQLERTNRYKQKIANLYRKNQITTTDITNLQRSIDRIETDLQIFDQHSIDVICNPSLTCSINIRMNINNWKSSDTSSSSSTSSSIIRQLEFRLKYVSLSGFVSSHYVLVHVNGTIGDLIDQFIQIEDKILINNRRREFFLATEISQNRLRQRFSNDIQLNMIFNQIHELVLYETPFELNTMNLQKYCLILSTFQDGLPWEMKFGLPILLKVPRFQCRGKDVINELDKILEKSLPCMINQQNKISYEVKIVAENQQVNPATILNEWADEVIDDHLLMADNATLIVNLVNDGKVTMKDQSVRLARLDGILKNGEKRRKSRK